MIGLLLAFGAFFAWWIIGLAFLVLMRADVASLRLALAAPALGTAVTVLLLFALSRAGAAMEEGALPLMSILLGLSVVVLVLRRPRVSLFVVPVIALCIANLFLIGRPMLSYGFNWIANANDDMANYVLAATTLLHHGLLAPLDVAALTNDRDYASAFQVFQTGGVRPGGNVMLAGLAAVVGRPPYQLYMPLTLALNLCAISGAGALAMQVSRRWIVAALAAALIAVSPLATYGVVQQLLPQVWGLGLAVVLLALLMRSELHRDPGPQLKDAVLVGILVAAVILVYVELAFTLALAYALYLALLAARRRIAVVPLLRLWAPAIAIICLVLNTYLLRELEFLSSQATFGLRGSGRAPLFGYSLVPSALPAVVGLDKFAPTSRGTNLNAAIAFSAFVLAVALVAAVISALRANAAAIALVTYAVLAIVLAAKSSDFGLFKLYMYVQPFLAAAVAMWIVGWSKRLLAVLFLPLAVLVGAQLRTQSRYVDDSREPIDLVHASSEDLLPAFQRLFDASHVPVISVTENPVLVKLEAARAGSRTLHFISRDVFTDVLTSYAASSPEEVASDAARIKRTDTWRPRAFDLLSPKRALDEFRDNTRASSLLDRDTCRIILPTGKQLPFNRLSLPERLDASLVARPCTTRQPLLVFTQSRLGESYYLPANRRRVSFYQPEPDYFNEGRTFVGFGRYALFRVMGASRPFRLELDLTETLRHDGRNALPPASAIGATRVRLRLTGRGSARVYSPPLRPQMIGGQPYVLLDMGREGRLPFVKRSGVEGLYGRSIPLDIRYLTSYVRDISVVTARHYRGLAAPARVRRFPADLRDPSLEYSGIYEDGWVAERSFVTLRAGDAGRLVIRADVLRRAQPSLQVLVDGRTVLSKRVAAGSLEVNVPVSASRTRRRVELVWDGATRLSAPDLRPVAALLEFVGIVPASSR